MAGRNLAAVLVDQGRVALIPITGDSIAASMPGGWALGKLEAALVAQGATVRRLASLADAAGDEFCVLAGGTKAPLAQTILSSAKILAPTEAESLCLLQTSAQGRTVLLAAGADERGLVYALTELADRVACLATGRAALEFAQPVIERPASRIRSILRGFNSEVEDKSWFYDRDGWIIYLDLLVTCRINRLNFSTGMGYNAVQNIGDGYFILPFPFLIATPGYDVRVQGLSTGERARNLATLKFIGGECARRGLLFQFGIWTLAHEWRDSPDATYKISGLDDTTHAAYCRDTLAILLREVPSITGVTLRVHYESGIPRGQHDFWDIFFRSIKDCGRRVEIDMHAKDVAPETLHAALATGQPVVMSPKFCGEHQSLPYHQADIRKAEMIPIEKLTDTGTGFLEGDRFFTRYGYGDMLAENRDWDVVFRIWPGTQRFLLSGDPATYAGYGRTASFCGAAGFELSEPLHFKGRRGSGLAGGRLGYADATLTPRFDFQKYVYQYRLWGRLGYNPDTDPEVWRRALRQEFGSAGLAIEQALAAVTRVLPLFTTAHGISANCTFYWPEIYTNLSMGKPDEGVNWDRQPLMAFGGIAGLDSQLFMSAEACGDALLAGRPPEKYTPLEVAAWLDDLAATAGTQLDQARTQLGAAARAPAFRRIEEDVLILQGMARFFAGKFRCAVLWRLHTATGDRASGEAAIARYQEARDLWATMAARAQRVYVANITYGEGRMRGHWADRTASFDQDIAELRAMLATAVSPAGAPSAGALSLARAAVQTRPVRPSVVASHRAVENYRAGQPLPISLQVAGSPSRVTLRYRYVNQAERWQSLALKSEGGTFAGAIPAAYTTKRYALQYYFEIATAPAALALFPGLAADLANQPYYVVRRAA
ncbi:MAG: hypothetical protein ABIZ81_11010 [Opitutaceae bacterium]